MKSIVFFNNKGGVGKTTFSYHLGHALADQGKRVLFVDADPQCNLTSWFCNEEIISSAWNKGDDKTNFSIYDAVAPIISGAGDYIDIPPYKVPDKNIWIFIGDLMLSDFETELSSAWTQVLAGQERGFRVTSAIYRLMNKFAEENYIDYVLVDIGPNLGVLNRALLLSCDNYIIPMVPDMFSMRGTQNIGRVFANWIALYQQSLTRVGDLDFAVAPGMPCFAGYILQQFNKYRKTVTKAYEKWAVRIPATVQNYIIDPLSAPTLHQYGLIAANSEVQLTEFKNYNSLMPMAQEALKPVFDLTASDGVVGGHIAYVRECRKEFNDITHSIEARLS